MVAKLDMYPRGSSDPFDKSFWFISKSMGYPEDTVAGGYGVPFEEAELVLIKHYYSRIRQIVPGRKMVGGSLVGLGTAMLIPGPVDALAYGLGVGALKHPFGGVVGVGVYNALAFATIGVGALMMTDF